MIRPSVRARDGGLIEVFGSNAKRYIFATWARHGFADLPVGQIHPRHSGARSERREPGIHNHRCLLSTALRPQLRATSTFVVMDSGLALSARPGMTKELHPPRKRGFSTSRPFGLITDAAEYWVARFCGRRLEWVGGGKSSARLFAKRGGDVAEAVERRLQVFDDLGRDFIGRRQQIGIVERVILEPEDVEIDLVARQQLGSGKRLNARSPRARAGGPIGSRRRNRRDRRAPSAALSA